MTEPPEDAWPTLEEPRIVTAEPAAPPPPPPPDRNIGAGMLLALGAIGLVAIGLLLALLLIHRNHNATSTTVVVTSAPATQPTATRPRASAARSVAVPDLVGLSTDAAEAKLKGLGLRVALTTATSDRPAGSIVDQVPAAGSKEPRGRLVTLSVARVASTVATSTEASTTTSASTTSPTATGTTTTTATASPPQPSSMPDVGGQTEQAAVTSLSRTGILPSLFFVPSSEPLGAVVQQAKPAGTSVPYHTHVQVNVSRGPGQKQDVQVPNVVGSTLTDAVKTLNGAGLRLIYVRFPVTAASQVGKVVQQSPMSGGKAPQNAQVLVFLGVRR